MTHVDRSGGSDPALEAAVRSLGASLDWPSAQPPAGAPDVAMRVRARIAAAPPSAGRGWSRWRPARRALLIALVALVLVVAAGAAVAFGVPGIRLSFGTPPASPPPTPAPGT